MFNSSSPDWYCPSYNSLDFFAIQSSSDKNTSEIPSSSDDVPLSLAGKRKKHEISCPHKDRKHYAKSMCSNCYHNQGRTKKAWLCPHQDKAHYARGKCQTCYLYQYHQVTHTLHNPFLGQERLQSQQVLSRN